MADSTPPDSSQNSLLWLHQTDWWVNPNHFVNPVEKVIPFRGSILIPIHDGPVDGLIPISKYLDMLHAKFNSLKKTSTPFKDDGTVDLLMMKAFFKETTGYQYDVCWGICSDPANCPLPKRDHRCMVWVCHRPSQDEPAPLFSTWPIGMERKGEIGDGHESEKWKHEDSEAEEHETNDSESEMNQ